jgi:hypothetical protein
LLRGKLYAASFACDTYNKVKIKKLIKKKEVWVG